MLLHPLDRKLMARLAERMSEASDVAVMQLVDGAAIDYADYRWRCGYLRGVVDMREWMRAIAEEEEPVDPRQAT